MRLTFGGGKGKIVKILTRARVGNVEKILNGTLLIRVKDVDDMTTSWGLKK